TPTPRKFTAGAGAASTGAPRTRSATAARCSAVPRWRRTAGRGKPPPCGAWRPNWTGPAATAARPGRAPRARPAGRPSPPPPRGAPRVTRRLYPCAPGGVDPLGLALRPRRREGVRRPEVAVDRAGPRPGLLGARVHRPRARQLGGVRGRGAGSLPSPGRVRGWNGGEPNP